MATHTDLRLKTGAEAAPETPTYAGAFRCAGAGCEDPCCGGWDIPVDRATYEKYQRLKLRELERSISEFVTIAEGPQPDAVFARINRGASGACPFWGSDHLCGIQKAYGSELLPATCSIYPRSLSLVGGRLEGALSLSCPEATRNVLLDPEFLCSEHDLYLGGFRTDNVYFLADDALNKQAESFSDIRALMVEIVRDRSKPIWQRLLLIESFCKSADELEREDRGKALAAMICGYRDLLARRNVLADVAKMPRHSEMRLKAVVRLSAAVIEAGIDGRFGEIVEKFSAAGGFTESNDLRIAADRFLLAESRFYRPFVERYPFMPENYLLNFMFQNLFPYGRSGSGDFTSRSMFEEYLQMATQFAWIEALLTGVAGFYKEQFGSEQVVRTVQAFCRSVEHCPDVLALTLKTVRELGLADLEGMSVLLRS